MHTCCKDGAWGGPEVLPNQPLAHAHRGVQNRRSCSSAVMAATWKAQPQQVIKFKATGHYHLLGQQVGSTWRAHPD